MLLFFLSAAVSAQGTTSGSSPLAYLLSIEDTESYSATERVLIGERSLAMRDLGLYFTASYTRRNRDAFADFNPENLSREHYAVGLDWEILKNGFYDNRTQARIKELELELAGLTEIEFHRKRRYYYQFVLLAYLFDEARSELLDKRLEGLEKQHSHFKKLYAERYIEKEHLLELEKRIHEIELTKQSTTRGIETFNELFAKEQTSLDMEVLKELPGEEVLSIAIDSMMEDVNARSYLNDIVEVKEQIVIREHNLRSEIRLTAFLDLNRQVNFSGQTRAYSSMGMAMRVPLRSRRKELRHYKEAKVDGFYEDMTFEIMNREKEVLSLYKEYAYKQKQIQNLSHALELVEERLRINRIMRNSVDYIPEEEVQVLNDDDVLALRQETQDLKQQLFEILLRINLLLPEHNVTEYLTAREITPIAGGVGGSAYSKHAVVVQAKDMFMNNAEFKAHFLEHKGISTVFIHTKDKTQPFEQVLNTFSKTRIHGYVILPVKTIQELDFDTLRSFEDVIRKHGGKGVGLRIEFEANKEALTKLNRFRLEAFAKGSVYPVLAQTEHPLLISTKRLPVFIEKGFEYVESKPGGNTAYAINNPEAWIRQELEIIK